MQATNSMVQTLLQRRLLIHACTYLFHDQVAPIVLNLAALQAYFSIPLNDAARSLGVCATAIKKV